MEVVHVVVHCKHAIYSMNKSSVGTLNMPGTETMAVMKLKQSKKKKEKK